MSSWICKCGQTFKSDIDMYIKLIIHTSISDESFNFGLKLPFTSTFVSYTFIRDQYSDDHQTDLLHSFMHVHESYFDNS